MFDFVSDDKFEADLMAEQKELLKDVDVICSFMHGGSIIPLRVRITDEDGQRQAFTIKEYRDLSGLGARTMPDGVYVSDTTLVYECKICVFDKLRLIRLYYTPSRMAWKITL